MIRTSNQISKSMKNLHLIEPVNRIQEFRNKTFLLFIFLSVFILSCSSQNDDLTSGSNVPPKVSGLLPDTGQTSSYTSTPGEDADFTINSPSFTDNGNELFSINNFDKVNPALDQTFFTKTTAEYWWTSDLRADIASNVWVTNAGGGIGAHPKTETISAGGTKRFHVRAVRTNTAITLPSIHFKDNGDGTVTDNYTGLIWQKTQNSGTLTWEEALIYAKGLSLSGKSDWRVPNIKELQSLNDEKLFKPSFNKSFFPNILSGNFWSSTSQVNSPSRA
jgi:hypothetical protein